MNVVHNLLKDELILEIRPKKGRPNIHLEHFKLWVDDEGKLCAIAITNYTKELEELRKDLAGPRLSRMERKRQLAAAAEALLPDYTSDAELTIFTVLDSEDFHE